MSSGRVFQLKAEIYKHREARGKLNTYLKIGEVKVCKYNQENVE